MKTKKTAKSNKAADDKIRVTDTTGAVPSNLKRIIWVTGGKGGVGKSTVARGLYDLLRTQQVQLKAFDSDTDNPQLYRYYRNVGQGVTRIDLSKKGQADALLSAMDSEKPDVILVDVAAGESKALQNLNADQRILIDAAEMGYKFTIVSVISRIKDSIKLLKMTMEATAAFDLDHLVVKNLYFGNADRFQLFDASKTRAKLERTGGLLLALPELFDDTYAVLDEKNMPFSIAAKADSGLARSHRARVIQWLNLWEVQAKIAGERIGL